MSERMLRDYLGDKGLAVVSAYNASKETMKISICGVHILNDMQISLFLPNGHQFVDDQLVTVHLDNRTGVAEYDADLKVYRASFKGRVRLTHPHQVLVDAMEYQLFYGANIAKKFQESGYHYPTDHRTRSPLPYSPMAQVPSIDIEENDNKIGILFTYAQNQPHSTVMAFLSTINDDIFFITFKGTFKEQLLSRDNRCYFAIDSRATFTFENAIEWNYSIIQGEVYEIPKSSPIFSEVQARFIIKNPWEVGFFSHPDVVMFHLQAQHVVCPTRGKL
ncbi:hypothetical protein [Celerinatantimonas yamalensis]|uniref:Uncharacterized protein n=1 Tax=Celerinatantimonas yamalensis TaxID=559956 RepID=A0ABW9G8A7_9GAMM